MENPKMFNNIWILCARCVFSHYASISVFGSSSSFWLCRIVVIDVNNSVNDGGIGEKPSGVCGIKWFFTLAGARTADSIFSFNTVGSVSISSGLDLCLCVCDCVYVCMWWWVCQGSPLEDGNKSSEWVRADANDGRGAVRVRWLRDEMPEELQARK